jgi:hypothetical protein
LFLVAKGKHPTYALRDEDRLPLSTLDPAQLPSDFKIHPLRGNDLKEWFVLVTGEAPNKDAGTGPDNAVRSAGDVYERRSR